MSGLLIGLVIIGIGLYYLPRKDAEVHVKRKNKNLVYLLVIVWMLTVAFYVPFVINFFVLGLSNEGYVISHESKTYILAGISIVFYVLIGKFYIDRNKKAIDEIREELNS